MSEAATDPTRDLREQAAAEERAAILEIVERYARQLSHGHGTSGAQALQQIMDEISRRGRMPAADPPRPPANSPV